MQVVPSTLPVDEAATASAENGLVLMDGHGGIAWTFTIDAAIGTAHALLRAAEEARMQVPGGDDADDDGA